MSQQSFFLYVVLSAKSAFDPYELGAGVHSHLALTVTNHTDSTAGTAYLLTQTKPLPFSLPQKGRSLRAWHNFDSSPDSLLTIIPSLVQDPTERPAQADKLPPGLVYVEHKSPFGLHRILTRNALLYAYGLWTPQHEVLVFTNAENYDTLVQSAAHQPGHRTAWLYRMRPTANANVAVNTQRVCSRWARWVRESAALAHSSERFSLLEASLFPTTPGG